MNTGQFIHWYDLFVVIDDGSVAVSRYTQIESAIREQAKHVPDGVACLCVLPPDTKPPSDEIKRRVKALLTAVAPSLSCLAYAIEGTGFRGIMARASLVGMKIFTSRPYPIYVETSLALAVQRVLPHLTAGRAVTSNVNTIVELINDARLAWVPPAAPRVTDSLSPK